MRIVVTFGGPAAGWCELSHCPMEAFGPFPTSEEAHTFADTLPGWQQPHVLSLTAPDQAITADGHRGEPPHVAAT